MLRLDLHLDINAAYGRVLLTSATDSSLRQPAPSIVAGDAMPVRLYFWSRSSTGTLTAADPGETSVILFSARPAGVPSGSDLLFLCDNFTETETGVWDGSLSLATAELAAHLATAPAGAKIITGEVEIQNADDTQRLSYQFDLTARAQVYDNQDTPLSLPTPAAWLETQRPAPLIRTLEQGQPSDGSLGTAQMATWEVVAASGCTSNGNVTVTVTGDFIGSPAIFAVALTTAAHTSATLIAAAIRAAADAYTWGSGLTWSLTDFYTIGGTGAEVVITAINPAANDATLDLAVTLTRGITALTATSSRAGAAPVAGDGTVIGQLAIAGDSDVYMLTSLTPNTWVAITPLMS